MKWCTHFISEWMKLFTEKFFTEIDYLHIYQALCYPQGTSNTKGYLAKDKLYLRI